MPRRPWKLAAWFWAIGLGGLPTPAWAGQSREAQIDSDDQATHRVAPGEVLGTIAERYAVKIELLRQINGIGPNGTIRLGASLLIPQRHTVAPGESLGSISNQYGVPVSEICRSSHIVAGDVIKPGQELVIPGGRWAKSARTGTKRPSGAQRSSEPQSSKAKKLQPAAGARSSRAVSTATKPVETYEHQVRRGEVLSSIAQRYAVPLSHVLRLNQLNRGKPIRVGQKLLIPVTDKNQRLTRSSARRSNRSSTSARRGPPRSWDKYSKPARRRGYVTLFGHGRRWEGYAIGPDGKLLPNARRGIQRVLASWRTGRQMPLSPRLIDLIVQLSDEFGGRPIRAVSGYRERSHAPNSKHKSGRALDFSVPGIPNAVLCDYLKSLPNVGVGFYPNSTHVHLDVRERRTFWIDYSRPGQRPEYRRPAPHNTPRPSDVAQSPAPRISDSGEVSLEDSSGHRS